MKKIPSKREIRKQIEQQMRDYLEEGGEVVEIERGTSGYHQGTPGSSTTLFNEPRAERTPLGDVVNELESRRRPARAPAVKRPAAKPRKVPVYDDFGEIVRWVWREPED